MGIKTRTVVTRTLLKSRKENNKKNNNKDQNQNKKRSEDISKTQIEVISPTLESPPEEEADKLSVKNVLAQQGQQVEFRVQTHGHVPNKVVMEYQQPGNEPVLVKELRKE